MVNVMTRARAVERTPVHIPYWSVKGDKADFMADVMARVNLFKRLETVTPANEVGAGNDSDPFACAFGDDVTYLDITTGMFTMLVAWDNVNNPTDVKISDVEVIGVNGKGRLYVRQAGTDNIASVLRDAVKLIEWQ